MAISGAVLLGSSILSSLLSTGYNIYNNAKQRSFVASENQKSRDFEKELSNTAYQRSVADLEKSGLNKFLAYGQGGAPVPTAVSTSAPSVADVGRHTGAVLEKIADFNKRNSAKEAEFQLRQDRLDIDREFMSLQSSKLRHELELAKKYDNRRGIGF